MAFRSVLLLFAFLFVMTASTASAAQIVLLHSVGSATPWTEGVTSGVASRLGEDVPVRPVFLGSFLEGEDHFDVMAEQLAESLEADALRVVVADGDVAFAFCCKYGESLFPKTPVVYCGMSRPVPELLAQCGDCTGVSLPDTVAQTVDFLFSLRPKPSVIVGVMDGLPEREAVRAEAEAAVERHSATSMLFPGHEPGDDGGLDMELLRSVASSVPSDGAVLLLGFEVDNFGRAVSMDDVLHVFGSRSEAPVFVTEGQWVRDGVLAGFGGEPVAHGRVVGDLVTRILAGEQAKDVAPVADAGRPIVDLTVLARLGLPADDLPKETVGLNPPARPDMEVVGVESSTLFLVAAGGLLVVLVFGVVLVARRRRS